MAKQARFPAAKAKRLGELVGWAKDSIVSCAVVQKQTGSVTLFSFDKGQELSEHTAPYDALVQVLDGAVRLKIGGKVVNAKAGDAVLMPAEVPHAVKATRRFKMLLTMIRG
jgi:quercetin dioxygenase-like cupin family protein